MNATVQRCGFVITITVLNFGYVATVTVTTKAVNPL